MTQEELGKGIISKSYLSKIENGAEIPSDDVLNLLKERLNLQDQDFQFKENDLNMLLQWNRLIVLKEKDKANQFFIESLSNLNPREFETRTYLTIFCLHFEILMDNKEKAKSLYDSLSLVDPSTLNTNLQFFYYKILGFYKYVEKDFKGSLFLLEKANEIDDLHEVTGHDIAHLNFLLGLCNSKLRKVQQSIWYTEKSLAFYKQDYNLKRMMECHHLLGIGYNRAQIFNEAESHYNKAYNISHALGDKETLSKVHHNKAFFHATKGEHQAAIEQYIASYEVKNEFNYGESLLPTIYCLAVAYFKKDHYRDCNEWIHKGIQLLKELYKNEYDVNNYYFHLKSIEKYIMKDSDFEDFILTKTLPHFAERGHLEYVARYNNLLGKYYEDARKYKKSSEHYNRCINILKTNEYYGGLIL